MVMKFEDKTKIKNTIKCLVYEVIQEMGKSGKYDYVERIDRVTELMEIYYTPIKDILKNVEDDINL